jgi:hypothetical protein
MAGFRILDDGEDHPQGGFRILADPKIGQPEDLSFAEKYLAPALEKLGIGDIAGGNVRGSAVGRAAMGAADPGVALVQMGANAIGQGDAVNKGIQATEQQYQDARKAAGSEGFDPLRLVGNVGMTAFMGGAAPPVGLLDKAAPVVKAAAQGAGFGLLQPVTDGGDNFLAEKAKQAGLGVAAGAGTSLLGSMLARVVSPNASTNEAIQTLRSEGVRPTIGQSLGGMANSLEEKAQSLPFVGSMIQKARQRGADDFQSAVLNRAGDPIGATVGSRGNEGVAELGKKIGTAYDTVIPKMKVDVLDPQFVGRMSNLRSMVQGLPPQEAQQFDAVIAREIDARLSPNGTLSGQALKDAWNALRDKGQQFSRSTDGYQQDLGQAFKQAFQELKDHVSATNPAQDVQALKGADFAYAQFKRAQRAASSVGADEGNFTPAQFHAAVKAMDRSKDKAQFASGGALMQDLSSAGKSILTNKVPDSGTAGRVQLGLLAGALGGSAFAPAITAPAMAGMGVGALAYTRPVQNALSSLVSSRPNMAPKVANELRRLMALASYGAVPAAEAVRR